MPLPACRKSAAADVGRNSTRDSPIESWRSDTSTCTSDYSPVECPQTWTSTKSPMLISRSTHSAVANEGRGQLPTPQGSGFHPGSFEDLADGSSIHRLRSSECADLRLLLGGSRWGGGRARARPGWLGFRSPC